MAEQQPVPIVLSPEESALLAVQGELAEELGTVVFEPPSDGELLPMSEDELAFADRVGYARQVRVDQISTYERIAERRTFDIQQWLATTTKGLREQVAYLDHMLNLMAKHMQLPATAKSFKLPSVRLGRRKQQPILEIEDMPLAVAFAKERGIPTKVVETVSVTDLKEYYQATGELPDGCTYEERPDKPFVEY